jgi:Fe-S-cluster containining protein
VALDWHSMRCTIYERRPQICAEFAMGGTYCRDERDAWFGKSGASIPITVIRGA